MHLYLADAHPEARLGALVADHLGPRPHPAMSEEFTRGIRQHRALDRFSESNDGFCAARALIAPERRRFAGIIVDVCFDHFLASSWCRYSPIPLRDFIDAAYALTRTHEDLLTPEARSLFERMRVEDWLGTYASVEGIGAILDRIALRVRRGEIMRGAVADLIREREAMKRCFEAFHADAIAAMSFRAEPRWPAESWFAARAQSRNPA